MKSRPTSGPTAGSETKLRVVAAVCTMTTSATMMASGAICGRSASATCGQPSRSVVPSIVPSVATPRPSSPKTTTAIAASASPISAPGKRGLRRSPDKHQRQHEQAEAERRQAGLAERAGERDDLGDERAAGRRDADERRRLADDDVPGDAGEKAGGDRNRQQIGDEAEAERAAERQREADAERQRRRVGGVMRRAGGRQQRQRAGEDRRDGRIGADRHQPRSAEGGETDRAGEQRDEADLRREPREPRRRHLLGDGDGGERQAGDRVGAEVAPAPAGERPEQRPGLGRRGGGRGVHRFIGVAGSTGLTAAHSGQSPPRRQ